MSSFVRIRTEGGEATVSAAFAERAGSTVVDKPAVDAYGRPLPPKHRATRRASATPAEAPAKAQSQPAVSKEK
ncbi:MAG TPA: hypothetical protein VFL73_01935 [Solirubrobacteraceae bacterium]|nr:hypothetical protein [Solirubrobacteraceae bacterium]